MTKHTSRSSDREDCSEVEGAPALKIWGIEESGILTEAREIRDLDNDESSDVG